MYSSFGGLVPEVGVAVQHNLHSSTHGSGTSVRVPEVGVEPTRP